MTADVISAPNIPMKDQEESQQTTTGMTKSHLHKVPKQATCSLLDLTFTHSMFIEIH